MGFAFGAYYGQAEPQTVTQIVTEYKTEYVPHIITQVLEVERVVMEEVEVEKIVEVPIELREFESVEELRAWLAIDDTNTVLRFVGSINLDRYDCEDFAFQLIKNARQDGYDVYFQFIKTYTRPDTGEYIYDHALNSTIIGNDIYLIEPQTDEFWRAAYMDEVGSIIWHSYSPPAITFIPYVASSGDDNDDEEEDNNSKPPKKPKGDRKWIGLDDFFITQNR